MSHFLNAAGLSPRHVDHLEALAQELERPIIMVNGSARRVSFDSQNREHWRRWISETWVQSQHDGAVSYDELVDRGIMIFNWSGQHAQYIGTQREPFPGTLWSDGEPRFSDMRDYMLDWNAGRLTRTANEAQHDPNRYTTTEPVYVPDTEYLIGEVCERTVYFHGAMEYMPELRRFQPALWYDACIRRSIDEAFAAELNERVISAARDAFIAFMSEGRMNNRVQRVRQTITDHEISINESRQILATSLRSARDSQTELDALMQIIGAGDIQWDEYWERLNGHPRIQRITWQEPHLTFQTDEVQLRHPVAGTTTPLGVMEVKVDVNMHTIAISNLTNPRGGRPHPHVNGTRPCFGEYEHAVANMLRDGDLAGLIELIFVYLETFNPRDDWGRYGAYWFRTDGSAIGNAAADAAVEAAQAGQELDPETEAEIEAEAAVEDEVNPELVDALD